MGVTKSVNEVIELENGNQMWVQAGGSNSRILLSFNIGDAEFGLWVTKEIAEQYANNILTVIKEIE